MSKLKKVVRHALTLITWASGATALTLPAKAAPVVEKLDRLEVNWSSLHVRYYGEAVAETTVGAANGASTSHQEADLKVAERRARLEAQTYAEQAFKGAGVASLRGVADQSKLADEAVKASQAMAKGAISYKTTYYGDGSVRVFFEGGLPQTLSAVGAMNFSPATASGDGPTHTGIVLKLNKSVKARAQYQLVDEAGATLFAARDMSEEAYKKVLMGRWYKRPAAAELGEAVGANPLVLEVQAQEDGKFVVSRAEWDQMIASNRSLLNNGAIAISLP